MSSIPDTRKEKKKTPTQKNTTLHIVEHIILSPAFRNGNRNVKPKFETSLKYTARHCIFLKGLGGQRFSSTVCLPGKRSWVQSLVPKQKTKTSKKFFLNLKKLNPRKLQSFTLIQCYLPQKVKIRFPFLNLKTDHQIMSIPSYASSSISLVFARSSSKFNTYKI